MNPRVGIGVFVFRDGKFLVVQRRGSHGEGSWAVPGGHLEFGESWEETAKREVREETGMNIKNVRFGVLTNDIFHEDNKHYVTIWMLSDWEDGEPFIAEPDKFIEQRWVDFENLPKPLFLPWNQLFESDSFASIKEICRQ